MHHLSGGDGLSICKNPSLKRYRSDHLIIRLFESEFELVGNVEAFKNKNILHFQLKNKYININRDMISQNIYNFSEI